MNKSAVANRKSTSKRICLINPPSPFLIDDKCNLPMGLLYLHATLEAHDCEVVIHDLAGLSRHQWSFPEGYDVYGVSAVTPQFPLATEIARRVKTPENTVILGGVHSTALPSASLQDTDFDIAVSGEGERTILEIMQGEELSHIAGISYKENGVIKNNPGRPFEDNLDLFPHPRIECLNHRDYHCGVFTTSDGDNITGTQVITARGCPHNCAFCCSPSIYRRRVRFHSFEYMRDWITYLNGLDYNAFYILDDTFTLRPKRLAQICELLKERGSLWRCCVRGDSVKPHILEMMYNSGCRQVDIGVETGSQRILDKSQKGEKVADNASAIVAARSVGIKVKACLISGLPGEEEEDVDATIDFVNEYNPDSVTLCGFVPFPGSRIHARAAEYGYEIDPEQTYEQYYCCGADATVPPLNKDKEKAIGLRQKLQKAIGERATRNVILNRKVKQLGDPGTENIQ